MDSCTIVMYHYVRELKHTRYPEIKGLDLNLFRQQIEFFKANYNIISTEQLLSDAPIENTMLLTVFPQVKNAKIPI